MSNYTILNMSARLETNPIYVKHITTNKPIYHYVHSIDMQQAQLKNKWCNNQTHEGNEIFCDNKTCSCGISRHHYHCEQCGGVSQVG